MKTIIVTVISNDPSDNSATSCTIERDRGAGQVRVDGKDIVTNKDKEVKFNLRAGDRLVIDAYQPNAVEYDREQGAAYTPASQRRSDGGLDKPKPGEGAKADAEEQRIREQVQREQQQARENKGTAAGGTVAGVTGGVKPQGVENNAEKGLQGNTGKGPAADAKNEASLKAAGTAGSGTKPNVASSTSVTGADTKK